jgi:hypothetical protein
MNPSERNSSVNRDSNEFVNDFNEIVTKLLLNEIINKHINIGNYKTAHE